MVSFFGRPLGALICISSLCAACGSEPGQANGASSVNCASRFATSVESFVPGPGPAFGEEDLPQVVLGPPKAGDPGEPGQPGNGSLDVVSLGNGGTITLGFAPSVISDGPGPDFIVFENPFFIAGDSSRPFAEPATVAVSEDGIEFQSFPCTATSVPFGSCAGWHPVYANPDRNAIDPTDPNVAGGDAFDLADLGVSQARYVRITDRVELTGLNGSFDLDAISIVHADCQ